MVDIIRYLLRPDSRVPIDASERLDLEIEILQAIQNQDVDQNHLVIDPVIVSIS